MVPSFALTIASDSERLTRGGFSLGQTICLGSFEFTADYFGGLSLSPRRGNSGAAFMGSTHSGTPSPWWAMIEESTEGILMTSSVERGSGLPSPRGHDTGALPAPVGTTPWMENTPATQDMTMVPPRTVVQRPDTGLPFEQWCACQEGQ
jgi:hypothetical protein